MKTLALILLLSTPALANNCYIHENPESRERCEREFSRLEKHKDEIKQDQKQTLAETSASMRNNLTIEQIITIIQLGKDEKPEK